MANYQKIEEYQRLFDTFSRIEATIYCYVFISKTIHATHGIERIFGCSKQQFNDQYWKNVIHPEDKDRVLKWKNETYSSKMPSSIQYRIIRMNNEIRWIEDHVTPVLNMFEEPEEILGLIIDITDRKETEQKIEYMAFHDTLTGLSNRNKLFEYSKKVLACCKRKVEEMAVLFIDLDGFKLINDLSGHEMGDIVLKQVAERLNRCVREGDIVTRQGGDEFVVLLEDTNKDRTEQIAQRILFSLAMPFKIQREEVRITASIGISLYPEHGADIDTLIRHADEAMYIAKTQGTNNYFFYQKDLQNKQARKIKLKRALCQAVENNELALYYQPIIDFYTGDIIGMEALIRWFHPVHGLILPLELIPIAEEYGLIEAIGEWVLEKACAQNKSWQNMGFTPIKMIVNISNHQFKNPDFTNIVKGVLIKTGLAPAYLELDITEGFMQNIEESLPIAQELASLGVKVSVDDFGTGVFSFNVLNRLPIEYLKIDKNLIHDYTNNKTSTLIKAMIKMAESLNLKLMAEGIENQEHIDFLKANNCFLGQGDFYSPPVPAEEAQELLKNFYGWKNKYGSMKSDGLSRIKKIEEENKKLKQLLAELALQQKDGALAALLSQDESD